MPAPFHHIAANLDDSTESLVEKTLTEAGIREPN